MPVLFRRGQLFFKMVQSMWYPPITKQSNLTYELPSCLCLESSGSCESCYCNFSCPQCEAVSCCCIEIKLRQPSLTSFTQQPTSSDPSKTTTRNTFSPSGNVTAQERLFQTSNKSGIVTSQVHMNRAFDESVGNVAERQIQEEWPKKSKLKPISSRNTATKVVLVDDKEDESGSIQVKGKRIRQRKKHSNDNDRVVPLKENPVKEVLPRKRPRKKKTKPCPNQARESTTVEPLSERKVPSPKGASKAQMLPSSSFKSSSTSLSTGNRNLKKVTWRNQPLKPSDC